jgi:hypothetical protein
MNTRAAEIVTALMEALEAKEFDKAATCLSDDFQFTGSTPRPLNKDQFIRLSSELAEGMPISLPTIPETGLPVSLPEAHWEYLVRGEAITTIDVEWVPGGGISGMLQQLGINIPII